VSLSVSVSNDFMITKTLCLSVFVITYVCTNTHNLPLLHTHIDICYDNTYVVIQYKDNTYVVNLPLLHTHTDICNDNICIVFVLNDNICTDKDNICIVITYV